MYGLRIGFEKSGIVQVKTVESCIHSMKDHRELRARLLELRSYVSGQRTAS